MTDRVHWLIDFDDTLCLGLTTWAYDHVFPEFALQHQLPCEEVQLEAAVLHAQERASREPNPMPIMSELFDTMGWPDALLLPLLTTIYKSFQPSLFEDSIPFLKKLQAHGIRVYIVSNNPHTPETATALGLSGLVVDIITPSNCNDIQPKPDPGLWNCLVSKYPEIVPEEALIIGDDPWSDGLFSENCGVPCWLVDRSRRLTTLRTTTDYNWASSLLDIPL